MTDNNLNNNDSRTEILLEELNGQFRAFGEGQDMLSQQLIEFKEDTNAHFAKLEKRMDARFNDVDKRFDAVDARFDKMDIRINNLEKNMNTKFKAADKEFASIRKEIKELRPILKKKADLDRLEVLEAKVNSLQKIAKK